MKTLLVPLAVVSLLTGCATINHTPLAKDASQQLQGKTLAVAQHPIPDFAAFTAGKAAFALIGALAMIAEGNAIIKDNAVPDPAVAIAEGLAEKLVSARAMKAGPLGKVAQDDKLDALVAANPGADYIVDVKTLNWMFNYYPSNWSHYRVSYSARVRLIDAARKSVVAESACQTVQGDDAKPPTKDDLLKANAALLKAYLQKGAAACVDVLGKDVLRM